MRGQNKKFARHLLPLCGTLTFLFSFFPSHCQVGVYIGSNDSIHFFKDDTASVFDNLYSDGTMGSNSGSDLIFFGQRWENSGTAVFPGEGRFTFEQPSSLGLNVSQSLGGVNWENRFPTMVLRNSNDVHLFGVSGNRDTFKFYAGCVIHNKNDFVIGDGNSGIIEGYRETNYFVTNHDNSSDSGFLIRHSVSTSAVDFPVGNAKNDYTPARLVNNGTSDTFSVRVFPNVYQFGTSGALVNDITVQRTWNILEHTAGGSSVDLTLQHNAPTEGGAYDRTDQYVSRYFGAPNNAYRDTALANFWDYAAPGNGYGNSAGDITTGSPVGFMATRSQSITTDFSTSAATRYFTKASTVAPIPVELLYLSANWIDESDAEITWSTATEINNEKFILQRSFDGFEFENLEEIFSKADGGNSYSLLNYSFIDNSINANTRKVFYKLVQVDYDGTQRDYGPVAIEREAILVKLDLKAYPNPANDRLFVNVAGDLYNSMSYELMDVLGQQVAEGVIDKLTFLHTLEIPVSQLASGNYWLRFTASESQQYTKPLEIIIAR